VSFGKSYQTNKAADAKATAEESPQQTTAIHIHRG